MIDMKETSVRNPPNAMATALVIRWARGKPPPPPDTRAPRTPRPPPEPPNRRERALIWAGVPIAFAQDTEDAAKTGDLASSSEQKRRR